MTATTKDQQVGFFHRFKEFKNKTDLEVWKESFASYRSFIYRFYDARENATEAERKEASSYNLFNILKLQSSEVRFHTPILANLLNPMGSHAQGDIFYKHFLAACLLRHGRLIDGANNVNLADLYVKDEKSTNYGNIDILIESREAFNRFVIIIENKVWAKDQHRQLYRYLCYARKELGLQPDRIRIVYLTPYGKEPSYDGLNPDEKKELKEVLVLASYTDHINKMLDRVLSGLQIEAPKVWSIVHQYKLTLNESF
jgi:hypothetical protein